MKKCLSILLALGCTFLFSGCYGAPIIFGPLISSGCQSLPLAFVFLMMMGGTGTYYVTDPAEYGNFETHIETEIGYFPEEISDYTVNSYSHTRYEYFDTCYEVFLDITVSEEQFQMLIAEAKSENRNKYEKSAYYAAGYQEIVFADEYEIYGDGYVGYSTIDKVIYNPETFNIVYESFHAHDTGVYPLSEVAYFNRFGINETEYVKKINDLKVF